MSASLNPFTLVGATTRSGLLTSPLRARFGIKCHLEYYDHAVLERIVRRSAAPDAGTPVQPDAAMEIASAAAAHHVLRTPFCGRVRDFAQVKGNGEITIANHATRLRH